MHTRLMFVLLSLDLHWAIAEQECPGFFRIVSHEVDDGITQTTAQPKTTTLPSLTTPDDSVCPLSNDSPFVFTKTGPGPFCTRIGSLCKDRTIIISATVTLNRSNISVVSTNNIVLDITVDLTTKQLIRRSYFDGVWSPKVTALEFDDFFPILLNIMLRIKPKEKNMKVEIDSIFMFDFRLYASQVNLTETKDLCVSGGITVNDMKVGMNL